MTHEQKQSCEEIDASIFSSDMLFDDESRKELGEYIARWTRAIDEHELAERLGE